LDGLRVSALVPTLLAARPRLPRDMDGRVLVVIQLTGGNDGLNTVVPHRQDEYTRLRPTLALERGKLHALDDEHGLHPSLGALAGLFAEGRLTVVHGVGYPAPNRSHFRSLEIWHSAEPMAPARGLGWLGRLADQIVAARPGSMPALHVGDEDLPLAMMGRDVFAPTVRDEESLRLAPLDGLSVARERWVAAPAKGELDFLRAAARSAYVAAERLDAALARPSHGSYPDFGLARKLRLVAKLIAGGFDTRLFFVTLGGFDTHARQAALHAAQLAELDQSLDAFQRELAAAGAGERVLTLVHSEFGRRVAENGSRGTDHGAAAPLFLVGGPGRGLLGTPPDLAHLVDGDMEHTTDFRAVYAAIERTWLGLEPSSAIAPLALGT
jgi:uncharacterized protein (DUF1501 family)